MKVIKKDLPADLERCELHIFSDEHIGDPLCDLQRLQHRIDYVRDNPQAYCVMNGDIMDNATKTSIGDTYTAEFNPMEQLRRAVELFGPIKDKIIAITHGNHENRTYKKEGINLSYLIAAQLGLADVYTPTSACIFLRLGNEYGRQICYTIYMLHGTGGGRKEGAKAIRLADMVSIIDTDIYIHSHTHQPMVLRQRFHRIDKINSTVALVEKLFVNTAANLDYDGGYGEAAEYKPSSKRTPVIYLSGVHKDYSAEL